MRAGLMLLLSMIALSGCGARPSVDNGSEGALPPSASSLAGERWNLTLIGTDERWRGEREAYFELSPSDEGFTLTGSDGCNRLRGEATLGEARRIEISELASTRMACPDLPQSAQVGGVLSQAYRYLIDHDRLVLLGRDGHVLGGFKRQE